MLSISKEMLTKAKSRPLCSRSVQHQQSGGQRLSFRQLRSSSLRLSLVYLRVPVSTCAVTRLSLVW